MSRKATRNVVWTVEWFDETKRRVLTETSSTQLIQDAQPFVQQGTDAKSKKRKLNSEAPVSQSSQSNPPPRPQDDVVSTAPDQNQPIEQHEVNPELQVNNAGLEGATPGRGTPAAEEKQQLTKRQADMAEMRPGDTRNDGQSMGSGQHRVFLLKPRTSTNRHVLIPLDPSQSLGESLQGRTILEFPTIHVFPAEMEKLPEDYMLEEEYAKLEGEQQREFDEMMQELDPEILKRLKEGEGRMPGDSGGGGDEEVDSKRILDVLKQDLGGRL